MKDSKFDAKLDLVIALLNENNINVHKLINTYKDSKLIYKVIGLAAEMDEAAWAELEEKLAGNDHHKDYRSTIQFARNMVINWLIEDATALILQSQGLKVTNSGGDGQREFLKGWKANSDPDLKINWDGREMWCEVIANFPTANYDSYWEEKGHFDLRDYKLDKLLKKSKSLPTIVLGINVKQQKYFTHKIHDQIIKLPKTEESNFGGKETTKVVFPNEKPTLNDFSKIAYTIKNILRDRQFKPLRPGYELEDFMTQYFEEQRGFCVAVETTDKDLLHVKYKITTEELQLYYVYFQEAEHNNTIKIPVDHIMNDYDWGFQYSFNDKPHLLYLQGPVIKHHILYNLKQKKVWEQWLDRETKSVLEIPTRYFPSIQKIQVHPNFLKIM